MNNPSSHNNQPQMLLNAPPWAELKADPDCPTRAIAFTPDEEHLVTGDKKKIRVWKLSGNRDQVREVATMELKDVRCIVVSKDGRRIAAATSWGEMRVWDAETFKELFVRSAEDSDGHTITSLDFSPDRNTPALLLVGSGNRKSCIWDVERQKKVVKDGEHPNWVIGAKFSPRGDRYATATFREQIRVYDSRNGDLTAITDSKLAEVVPYYNTGLLWSVDASIMVLSRQSINQIDITPSRSDSTKSLIQKLPVTTKWSVDDGSYPCIVSPESGKFILYSTGYDISLFHTSPENGEQDPIQIEEDAQSIVVSPKGRFLAIGGWERVVVKDREQSKAGQGQVPPPSRKASGLMAAVKAALTDGHP